MPRGPPSPPARFERNHMTAKTAHPGIRALLAVAYVVMLATNALANADERSIK